MNTNLSCVKLFIVWEVGETRDDHESITFKMFKAREGCIHDCFMTDP